MKTLFFTRESFDYYQKRINALQANAQPRWGSLLGAQMLKHLSAGFAISLGKLDTEDLSTFFTRHIIKNLLLYVLKKMPRNVKAPDFYTPPSDRSIDQEREILLENMELFLKDLESHPDRVVRHPFFGPMSLRQWSRLQGLHLDHHLKQFGV